MPWIWRRTAVRHFLCILCSWTDHVTLQVVLLFILGFPLNNSYGTNNISPSATPNNLVRRTERGLDQGSSQITFKTADSRATGAPAISVHQPPAAHWAAQWRTHPRVTWLGGRRDPFPWLRLQAWDYSGSNLSKCTYTYLNVGPDFTRLVTDIVAAFS